MPASVSLARLGPVGSVSTARAAPRQRGSRRVPQPADSGDRARTCDVRFWRLRLLRSGSAFAGVSRSHSRSQSHSRAAAARHEWSPRRIRAATGAARSPTRRAGPAQPSGRPLRETRLEVALERPSGLWGLIQDSASTWRASAGTLANAGDSVTVHLQVTVARIVSEGKDPDTGQHYKVGPGCPPARRFRLHDHRGLTGRRGTAPVWRGPTQLGFSPTARGARARGPLGFVL
jgi:hypothetical protein